MPDNSQTNYYNAQAAALAAQVANQAAQLEFQRLRFQQLELPQFQTMSALDKEKLAFQKATEVWNQAFQEASTTGAYNGVPAAQYLLSQAQLTGQTYQPGTLSASQQAKYQQLQTDIATTQNQLFSTPSTDPAYATLSSKLATLRAQLAPLTQILQGTNKAPVQTLAGQQQAFNQMATLAGLTGIVPTGTAATGTGTGTAPAGPPLDTNSPQYQDIQARIASGEITAEQGAAEWEALLANPPATTATGGAGAAGGAAGGTPTMAYLQMVAQLTGMFNGQPTPEMQQMLAALTGEFNGKPTQAAMEFAKQFGLSEAAVTGLYNGQPTQAAKEFEKNFGLSEAAVTGMYQGNPTQAAKEFAQQFGLSEAAVTGMYQGRPTQAAYEFQQNLALQREQEQNRTGLGLLNLAASLRGPKDAFQFAKVIGGTPAGLQDSLAAVMGRYNLPGFQGAGAAAPEAVTLGNFMGQVAQTAAGGSPWYGTPAPGLTPNVPGQAQLNVNDPYARQAPGAPGTYTPTTGQWGAASAVPPYTVNPPGAQAPTNAFNYQPTGDGSHTVFPPGISAPVQAGQVSAPTPLSAGQLSAIGTQALAAQPYQLPRPSQWNAQAYANLGAYRQDLLGAQYEAAGWDPQAAQDVFKASLPNYGGPQRSAIAGLV